MINLSTARRASLQRMSLPGLVLLSAAIIVVGAFDATMFQSVRLSAVDAATPLLRLLSRPLGPLANISEEAKGWIALHNENVRLETENRSLLQWQHAAINLAAENARLRMLLRLVPKGAVSYVTARVIANSGGAFARSLLIDAGRADGIERGQAVLTGAGLVGRVTDVGRLGARVLLLTDLNSRVPVLIEGADGREERALLAGNDTREPVLRFLPEKARIRVGDRVVTSGEGGIFPPGLPVGVVSGVAGHQPLVQPYVDFSQIVYLRVVDYGLSSALPKPVRLARNGRNALEHPLGAAAPGR